MQTVVRCKTCYIFGKQVGGTFIGEIQGCKERDEVKDHLSFWK